MKVSISIYWKCQLIGWGAWFLLNYLMLRMPFMNSLIPCIFGLVFTHFLRFLIKQLKIFNKTTVTQIVYLLILISIVAFLGTSLLIWVLDITGMLNKNLPPDSVRLSFWWEVIWNYQQTLSVGTAWTAIYFAVHYIMDLKKTEREKNALRVSLAESETMALRAQMNPQFIFNSVNSIKSLVTKNENEKAANYLTVFSKLIRTLFQNSDKKEISLFEEIETCKLYAQIEKMQFGEKVNFIFDVDEKIDLKDIKVPALIIQPFIENSIWHGLVPRESGGKVVVSVKKQNDTVECIIDDNGIGRELSKNYKASYKASHHSRGIGLTQSRLELDKLLNEREGTIFIIDKEGEEGKPDGTKVIIGFKPNSN